MTVQPSMISFSKLVPGDEINPRKGEPESIDELAASIRAKGVIQTLVARPIKGGKFEVYVGNRRLLAIGKVIEEDGLKSFEVPVMVREADDVDAAEVALAENVERLPLNVVDEVGAFADLQRRGRSVAEIAATFGISDRRVRQRLALGNLHPVVLEALRADRIGIDTAKLFTLTDDKQRQEHVFNQLSEQHGLTPYMVRESLSKDKVKASGGLAQFIGDEAYIEAGGAIREDLFDDERYFEDAGLLTTLVLDKVQVEIDALKADGWSWVRNADDCSEEWRWSWRRVNGEGDLSEEAEKRIAEVKAELDAMEDHEASEELWEKNDELQTELDDLEERPYTDDQKAKLGVVVRVGINGIEIHKGVLHPEDAKADKATSPADKTKDGPKPLPAALILDLSRHLTGACQLQLSRNGKHAEALLLASLVHQASQTYKPGYGKIDITASRYFENEKQALPAYTEFVERRDEVLKAVPTKSFGETVQHIADMTPKDRQALMAVLVAACLDVTHEGNGHDAAKVISDLITPRIHTSFKPDAEFFARLTSAQIKAAVTEACGKQLADAHAKDKKGELVQLAAREVGKTGWLPEPLRNAHYTGPGVKKPRAKKSAKAEATA